MGTGGHRHPGPGPLPHDRTSGHRPRPRYSPLGLLETHLSQLGPQLGHVALQATLLAEGGGQLCLTPVEQGLQILHAALSHRKLALPLLGAVSQGRALARSRRGELSGGNEGLWQRQKPQDRLPPASEPRAPSEGTGPGPPAQKASLPQTRSAHQDSTS